MFFFKRNGIPFVFLMLFGLCSCGKAPESEWITYTSTDHLYQIDYPRGWTTALNGHAYTISPPDGTGSAVVTAYLEPGLAFDEEAFKTMVMLDFSECHEMEAFKMVKGAKWQAEDAVYEQYISGQRVTWLFRIAHRGQVGVFIAVNELNVHLKDRLPKYKQIMDSLMVLKPEEEGFLGKLKAKERLWQEVVIKWLKSTEPQQKKNKK